MLNRPATKSPAHAPVPRRQPTLADLLSALTGRELPEIRERDLRSAVTRVALLLGDHPSHIPFDLPAISAKLAGITPATVGLSPKTLSNIRSNFVAAVQASGLEPVRTFARTPLSPAWKTFFAKLKQKRAHIGLGRLARYASANGIKPQNIDDSAIHAFIAEVRNRTLHRKPNGLHRSVAQIWNEAVRQSGLDLKPISVPSFRQPPKRIDLSLLPPSFRKDVNDYLTWCAGDPLASDARPRVLAPRTIDLRRNQIHAAATALVESGLNPKAIRSLASLVSIENFRRILRRRHEMVAGRENVFNHDLARNLLEIARQWIKVDAGTLTELRRLASKIPIPPPGLTEKNKRTLRQFDDPAVLQRLYAFPGRLWAEVKRDARPDSRTLVKAHAALAVGILSYMPIRPQNLASLEFDVHVFLKDLPNAISSLELPAAEVKNRQEAAYDIPVHLARMLLEYRNRLAPKIIGHRPKRLFVKADGTPKTQGTIAWTIRTYLKKRAGITFSGHKFRHLSASVMLNAEPGNFESLKQLLGHSSLRTTVNAYAGIDSRRAARHHQQLIEKTLASPQTTNQKTQKRG
jgi:integrase